MQDFYFGTEEICIKCIFFYFFFIVLAVLEKAAK